MYGTIQQKLVPAFFREATLPAGVAYYIYSYDDSGTPLGHFSENLPVEEKKNRDGTRDQSAREKK